MSEAPQQKMNQLPLSTGPGFGQDSLQVGSRRMHRDLQLRSGFFEALAGHQNRCKARLGWRQREGPLKVSGIRCDIRFRIADQDDRAGDLACGQ